MARGPYSPSNFFSHASALITAYPFTLSIWFRPTTLTAGSLIGYGNVVTTGDRWTLEMNSSGNARCSTTSSGIFTGFNSPNTISAGNWGHFAAVWAADADRRVFLNGQKATNTDNRAFATSANYNWRIGERPLNGFSAPVDGYIADPAIWAAALDDAQVVSLSRGYRPWHVRPRALVSYPDLVRGLRDLRGVIWTENGTVSVQPHARAA